MRKIKASQIKEAVSGLCIKAGVELRPDVLQALKRVRRAERNQRSGEILDILIENARIAAKEKLPICQDTGIAVVFVEIGQNVEVDGNLRQAINEGVKMGYAKGYLRKSVVSDPLQRKNTGDNAPAVIHYDVVPGDKIKVAVLPKGFGCENVSRVKMLKPTAGVKEIKEFVLEVVGGAGPDACPPYVVGVGIGGTQDYACFLAKKALLGKITSGERRAASGERSRTTGYGSKLEQDLMREINKLNIGPMGFGGKTTALGVKVLSYPTHIAGLPVAVNISCHALRSASAVI